MKGTVFPAGEPRAQLQAFQHVRFNPQPYRKRRHSPRVVPLFRGEKGLAHNRARLLKRAAVCYPLAFETLKALSIAPVAAGRSSALITADMEETAQLNAKISVSDRSRDWIRAWAIPYRSPK